MDLIAGQEFAFQTGSWTVRHRRLKTRLAGADDWQEFGGHCVATPLLGGNGNVEDNFIDFPGGAYRAVALRSYDLANGKWAIWWLDGRSPHQMDVPVKGEFLKGIGRFYAEDVFDGRAIKVRFQWMDILHETPKWDQAFSVDGGKTWETNWEMTFRKT